MKYLRIHLSLRKKQPVDHPLLIHPLETFQHPNKNYNEAAVHFLQ